MLSKEQALQVLDGLMLGDGCLGKHATDAHYWMGLSKILARNNLSLLERESLRCASLSDHLKWELWIADNPFQVLDIPVSMGYPKLMWRVYNGKSFQRAELVTRQSPQLTEVYDNWYTGGEWVKSGRNRYIRNASKILPVYLMEAAELPLLTLVHWWLGDGGSSWNFHIGRSPFPQASFAAHGFTTDEVYHLAGMLNNMGMHTTKLWSDKTVKMGSGMSIWLSQDSIDYFMDLVEPHILEIFGDSKSPSYKDMIKRKSNVPESKSSLLFSHLRSRLSH